MPSLGTLAPTLERVFALIVVSTMRRLWQGLMTQMVACSVPFILPTKFGAEILLGGRGLKHI